MITCPTFQGFLEHGDWLAMNYNGDPPKLVGGPKYMCF